MAHKASIAAVVGQGNRTVFAKGDVAAVHTSRHSGTATSVDEQNALLSPVQIQLQF